MNCTDMPPAPVYPFNQPTTATSAQLGLNATTRKVTAADERNRLRRMLVHYFAPPLSLLALNGGPTTADVFALLILAQSISQWGLVFHMPLTFRRWDKGYFTWVLGPLAKTKKRSDYTSRYDNKIPNAADIDGYMDIAYHSHQAFQRGLKLWRVAIQQRLASFQLSPTNGGKLSLCFSFTEVAQFLHDAPFITHAGHTKCNSNEMASSKLQTALREKLTWFTESTRMRGRFDRLYFMIQMKHKVVLMLYDQEQQNLIAFDAQLPTNPVAVPPAGVPVPVLLHDVPREELQSGMRVAVACVGELALICSFICTEVFYGFGSDTDTTPICFDTFVLGEKVDLCDESME